MSKKLWLTLIGAWFGALSCTAAHAQVGTILLHVLGSVVQGQIDEWDKSNDPNRGLKEYNAKGNFGGRDLYAPGSQPKYKGSFESGGFSRELYVPPPVTARPTEQPVIAPPAAE